MSNVTANRRDSYRRRDFASAPTARRVKRTVVKPYDTRATIRRRVIYDYETTKTAIRKRFLILKYALPTMALIIFGIGLYAGLQGINVNEKVEAQVETLAASTESHDAANSPDPPPSEDKPADIRPYTVAPDMPRYIHIPKLKQKARVLHLGLKADSEIDTPKNVFDTGWYNGSSKPGQLGTVFISGHVHGPKLPGVFFGLKKLVAGDEIQIERGDGAVITYAVRDAQTFPHDRVNMGHAFSSPDGNRSLTLITCAGNVISGTMDYSDRIVVRAVQK